MLDGRSKAPVRTTNKRTNERMRRKKNWKFGHHRFVHSEDAAMDALAVVTHKFRPIKINFFSFEH